MLIENETNETNEATEEQVKDLTKIVDDYESLFLEQEEKIKELETKASQPPPVVPLSSESLKEQWNQKFFENPSETTYALIQSALQSYLPTINQQVQPAMEQIGKNSKEEVRRARGKDFDQYEPAINEILSTFSPQNITPAVVDAAYLVSKGYDTFGDYKSALIESSSGYSPEGEEGTEITDLTPAQKKVAKRFGIKDEDYIARIKKIEERKRRREELI